MNAASTVSGWWSFIVFFILFFFYFVHSLQKKQKSEKKIKQNKNRNKKCKEEYKSIECDPRSSRSFRYLAAFVTIIVWAIFFSCCIFLHHFFCVCDSLNDFWSCIIAICSHNNYNSNNNNKSFQSEKTE